MQLGQLLQLYAYTGLIVKTVITRPSELLITLFWWM